MDEQANWFKDGVQFECTACGKCCQVPQGSHPLVAGLSFPGASLDDGEASALAAHLKMTDAQFRAEYVSASRNGFQSLVVIDGACVFYDKETKLCKVHEARPSSCRAFPFWWNIEAKMFWESYKGACEGIGRGPLVSEVEILEKLKNRRPNVYQNSKPLRPAESPVATLAVGDHRYADD